MADAREALVELRPKRVVDGDPLLARRRAEELVVEPVDPAQLGERVRVVVDAQVDERIGEARVASVALDDEQRRRLAATAVAAGGLRRVEAVEQPLRERGPAVASNVPASASTVAPETRMFPCAA